MAAYNGLDEFQKQDVNAEYQDWLAKVEAEAQARAEELKDKAVQEGANMSETISLTMATVAEKQQEAANALKEAADALKGAANSQRNPLLDKFAPSGDASGDGNGYIYTGPGAREILA